MEPKRRNPLTLAARFLRKEALYLVERGVDLLAETALTNEEHRLLAAQADAAANWSNRLIIRPLFGGDMPQFLQFGEPSEAVISLMIQAEVLTPELGSLDELRVMIRAYLLWLRTLLVAINSDPGRGLILLMSAMLAVLGEQPNDDNLAQQLDAITDRPELRAAVLRHHLSREDWGRIAETAVGELAESFSSEVPANLDPAIRERIMRARRLITDIVRAYYTGRARDIWPADH